jgi:hypothetical protein
VYPLIVFLSIKNKTTTKNNVENNRSVSPQKCFGKPNPPKRKKKLLTDLNAHFFKYLFQFVVLFQQVLEFPLKKKHTHKNGSNFLLLRGGETTSWGTSK